MNYHSNNEESLYMYTTLYLQDNSSHSDAVAQNFYQPYQNFLQSKT